MFSSGHVRGEQLSYAIAVQMAASIVLPTWKFGDIEFQFSSGTVTVTKSLDGINWVTAMVVASGDTTQTLASSAASPGIYRVANPTGLLQFSAPVTLRAGA